MVFRDSIQILIMCFPPKTGYQGYKRVIGRGSEKDGEAPASEEDGASKNTEEKHEYSLDNGGFEHDVNDKTNREARGVDTMTSL